MAASHVWLLMREMMRPASISHANSEDIGLVRGWGGGKHWERMVSIVIYVHTTDVIRP